MSFTPTDAQRRAIEAPIGPVLVVAGPGAGKTACLIERITRLITHEGVPAERICVVTFTNKAAQEIGGRLEAAVGPARHDLTAGTLHSLSAGILRDYADRIGLPPGFGIADEEYQRDVLRRVGARRRETSTILTHFRRYKLNDTPLPDWTHELFDAYERRLAHRGVIDFDDIIVRTAELLEGHPDVAEAVTVRWDHVLVDEFQDISALQFRIIDALAPHGRVFAVGDDEQSIFSWAGADPEVLHRFARRHGITEPVFLDLNRRCTRQIFDTARRLLAVNASLFAGKVIDAPREGAFDVEARAFLDEDEECRWVIEDLVADHEATGLPWGEYAILYRQHQVGAHFEKQLVAAGLPCRLARGRSLLDDPVIAYTLDSLRVMVSSDDPVPIATFADRVLPRDLLETVRTRVGPDGDLIGGLRTWARRQARGDPDARKAWRFVYHIENLHALWASHDDLNALIEDLLSQRAGRYGNPLQDRADELRDPEQIPEATDLADRIRTARREGGTLWVEPAGGREFAHLAMLRRAGLDPADYRTPDAPVRPKDLMLTRDDQLDAGFTVHLFKALQLLQSNAFRNTLEDFVAFDLETTDNDTDACEIVEIGAVRVRAGRIVDEYHQLVRCDRQVSVRATAVHGYTAADLANQPPFPDVWPQFRAFVGDDVLVAHNGQTFDVPVLKRMAAGRPGADDLVCYDTLPVARALFDGSRKLGALAVALGIDTGRAHHALDDARTLAHVVHGLNARRLTRARIATFVDALDLVGLALALSPSVAALEGEAAVLFDIARVFTVGRYSDCLDDYAAAHPTLDPDAPPPDAVIERLGGIEFMERVRRRKTGSERYPQAVARLRTLIDASPGATLAERTRGLLELVALSTSTEVDVSPNRVNLLTLHATKGLEFSRVYIVGVEDYQIPGYYAKVDNRQDEIAEARRLLYVGMTRAKDRLVLTRADRRRGREAGGSQFLEELGLSAHVHRPAAAPAPHA